MNNLYIFGGIVGTVLVGLWVLSVEMRLKAANILGEIVFEDLHKRGVITKETLESVVAAKRKD